MNENQKKVTDQYRNSYDKIFGKAQPSAVKERAALGTKGFIMRSADGQHFFRVYDDNTFTDYNIMHYDMEVQILEDSAVFVEQGDKKYIDYSARVLGYVD